MEATVEELNQNKVEIIKVQPKSNYIEIKLDLNTEFVISIVVLIVITSLCVVMIQLFKHN